VPRVNRLVFGYAGLCLLWPALPACAALCFSDSFAYTNGPLVTVSGGAWNTHSGTTGQVQVVSGRVCLAYTNTEDVSASLGQSYPAGTNLALYASFTISSSRFPAGSGDYFAHFKAAGATAGFRAKIFATSNGVPAGFFRVGIANGDNTPSVLISSNLSLNTDYVVVARYVLSNATSTLWLNPSAESDPGVTATDPASASAESVFALRETTDTGILYLDNLVIGTNFVDVLPSVPAGIVAPPQSQVVTEGNNVTFTVVASGTPPLSYQWQFNGTNLDGATASVLPLPGIATNQAGDYAVTVTNAFGSTNSAAATLTVNPLLLPPVITAQPTDVTVLAGGEAKFAVEATGTQPLSYQWQFNGTNLEGATASLLWLTNVSTAQAGAYAALVTNLAGVTNSQAGILTVTVLPPAAAALSIVTYNVLGAGATNWSTNSPQVQAVGRQMQYLNPDIITFQEIPMSLAYEMTNFVQVYLPGYYYSNSATADGWTRDSIASRYPITRATSWLRQADLAPYGYTNSNFSRDLYEAQITVPGFEQPLHVFTLHLKSGSSADERAKRNAEACAVSNYLVTAFLTTNASRPYVVTGDLNETDTNQASIQTLISAPVGLQLTTPVNPFNGSVLTYSIQNPNGLTKRFDYILPGAMLFTNMTGSQVFRTDLLTDPPPPLLASDAATASDHLPVVMYFNNPYSLPFRVVGLSVTNQELTLVWESSIGRVYAVESTSNFTSWAVLASNVTASGTNCSYCTSNTGAQTFFRVSRMP
jgi:endonuclease/exonuclease/phosphatase family metal-dependent hydrolase